MRSFFLLLAGVVLLSGCAAMTKEECLTADWTAIGYEDGAAGYDFTRMTERRQICAESAAVTLDFEAYEEGRNRGLAAYCKPSVGFEVGSRGQAYNGVCSGAGETAFLRAFDAGRLLYSMERDIGAMHADIQDADTELRDLDDRIHDVEAQLLDPLISHKERIPLVKDLKELSGERTELERDLRGMRRTLVRAEGALYDYRRELRRYGPSGVPLP